MLPVDTNQPVLGLRVGVGFKRNLKGRQKKGGGGGRNRGIIKVQNVNSCPCEENVGTDVFNVS